ncbi:MAG: TonB-dependent receptor plug domain-containing protein [Acidobacteria bacterium]|nr:TonB-dependent receptor plug domain-containing protein [Acidobacteriota bacterium]
MLIELPGLAPMRRETQVDLGRSTRVDATLGVAGVAETVTVTAETPSIVTSTTGGANYTEAEIDKLATPRTLSGIAQLAPGLTSNTPNAGQVTISGAFAYDNVFLIDGVDANDNLFGTSNNLFIEAAIAEVQVLTSGVSAEYGRFSGGVVNAITKSGSNQFEGTFRVNLTNPSWTDETPFERERDQDRPDELSQVYEATFGGPILRDRLWFFSAGRFEESTDADPFPVTGIPVSRLNENTRYEGKLTGTIANGHTLQGAYTNNATDQTRPTFGFSVVPGTIVSRTLPNNLAVVNYRGVLGSRLFATAQVSRKEFGFRNSGGTSTAITDSPFLTRGSAPGIVFSHYNAPYFDSTDPEDRNNNQVAASLSYFLTTGRLGSHDIKGGFENYVSSRTGGNSQTATDFVFQADYLTAGGEPVLNGQQLIPTFVPGVTRAQNWLSTRGATIDIRTTSLYLHDKWTANENWTFDLGMRLRERRQRSDRRPDDGRYLDHRPEARGRVRSYRDRTARLPEHVCPLRRQVQRGTVCGEHERR